MLEPPPLTGSHINMADMDVADSAIRLGLGEAMERLRAEGGITRAALSIACGHRNNWFNGLYRTSNWRLGTLQKVFRILGYRLRWVVRGAVVPVPADEPDAAFQDLMMAMGIDFLEEAERVELQDLLRRYREGAGVSRSEFSARVMTAPSNLKSWEEGEEPQFLVLTAQRFFRALGCELRFLLEDSGGVVREIPAVHVDSVPTVLVTQSRRAASRAPRNTLRALKTTPGTVSPAVHLLSTDDRISAQVIVLAAIEDLCHMLLMEPATMIFPDRRLENHIHELLTIRADLAAQWQLKYDDKRGWTGPLAT